MSAQAIIWLVIAVGCGLILLGVFVDWWRHRRAEHGR